ncbi:MAG: hypothetical protein ACOX6Y_11185 [Christensenellales bacterium]
MRTILKRITALLAALMMLTSAGLALAAEAPQVPAALKVIESGGAVGYEASAYFDGEALKGLMALAMGGAPADEATGTMIATAIAALNKLSMKGVYTRNNASGVLGTDLGEVITFQISANEETMDNTVTTNLLPDVALQMDPAMMKTYMGQQNKITPEKMQEKVGPYLGVLASFLAEQAGPKPEKAATPYDIAGVGKFDYMSAFEITRHEVAGLLEKLFGLFKEDKQLQGMMQQSPSVKGQSLEEGLQEFEAGIASMKEAPDAVLFTGSVYQNEAGDSSYFVMDTPEAGATKVRFTVLTAGQEGAKVKVIVKNAAPQMEPAAEGSAEAPAAPVDWDALESEILSGKNFQDVLVLVDVSVKPGETGVTSLTKVSAFVMGMNIVIEADTTSRLDKLEENGNLKIYLNSPTPLVTVAMKLFETTDKPVAPAAEGLPLITLKADEAGELSPSDPEKLMLSLQSGLPILMENLNKALPEEGPALVAMIGNALNPPQPEVAEEAPAEPVATSNP